MKAAEAERANSLDLDTDTQLEKRAGVLAACATQDSIEAPRWFEQTQGRAPSRAKLLPLPQPRRLRGRVTIAGLQRCIE